MNSHDDDPFTLTERLSDPQIVQLHNLIRQQWWGTKRILTDVQSMVQNTSLMLGLIRRSDDQLVGYCRVLTDFVFRATIYDVMIDKTLQGRGLGKQLIDALCNHPKLQCVSFLYLACDPELYAFYETWGFKPYQGKAQWMIKVQREE
ncbi:MAG: GNAT family N-acetyltransferase [Pirellulaceae bacterium]|nr:GNAT family N-acetyltransferase [Pirellulaceae bacterium]